MPLPPSGVANPQRKVSATEGNWSFDIISTQNNGQTLKTATLTYYSGRNAAVVLVPAVLGGVSVTRIGAQAFGHHDEIAAVFVPDSVKEIADWAFYDLNKASLLSIANPAVAMNTGAIQSSGQLTVWLPEGARVPALSVPIKTEMTSLVSFMLSGTASAAIAGGNYLAVKGTVHGKVTHEMISGLGKSASGRPGDVQTSDRMQTFSGEAYRAVTPVLTIAQPLQGKVRASQVHFTLRALTPTQAEALNQQLAGDREFSQVAPRLHFSAGYYLNGAAVALDRHTLAWDISTGKPVKRDSATGLFPGTDSGPYKYVAWFDDNRDGFIDRLYYTSAPLSYQYDEVKLRSKTPELNGLSARTRLNPQYLAFANGVKTVSGSDDRQTLLSATLNSAKSGESVLRHSNMNRSVLWADNYGSLSVAHLKARSTSIGDWARISLESGLTGVNSEIIMEWGMNAVLYATNGGQISVGDKAGKISELYANGDGANGILAGGAGDKAGRADAPADTARVRLINARAVLEGWNNHLADTVYGGYVSLENVQAVTGKAGSYAVGQASALANDFGDGVVDAKGVHVTVWGNRSAGAYVIGGGLISIDHSSLVSRADAGLVIASGGRFVVTDTQITGQMAIRNRGGITADASSTFSHVSLNVVKDLTGYHVGQQAKKAVNAWQQASGGLTLANFLQSDATMTLGQLADYYQLDGVKRTTLFHELSQIAGKVYNAATPLRNSLLDNTFYNYSASAFRGETDFSDIPWLTVGSSFGGLVASALESEGAGSQLNFNHLTVKYDLSSDFQYLLVSEAGSAASVTIKNSHVSGLVWNEGRVNRAVEGRPGERNSSLQIHFLNSKFTGSFADGDDGLWSVAGLAYQDRQGNKRSLNGNYYGAEANHQGKATFDDGSHWYITHSSWLGELTLTRKNQIIPPEGKQVIMKVNGKVTPLLPGHYKGEVVLNVR